jgi:ketosteroid isomerase-like protein
MNKLMTKRKIFPILYLAAISMLPFEYISAQSDSKANFEEAKKAIAASNEIYFQSFAKNDASIFINQYADDCWIMAPNAPSLCGPDAAGDFFRRGYNLGVRNGKFITTDVYGVSEDIVAEIGFWKLYNAGDSEVDDGKFLVLWKKTQKGWKMWRHSFSSNRSHSAAVKN